ncbi:isochorismatase family protein [Dongia sp.]|uniref:isochorismatase family protein n=1 Tax=Dongia sp. TaxID=1977262 RepID=UPI003750EE7C
MTTLPNRPNAALLVIDMQIAVVAKAHARDAVVANIAALVERARAERVPVVWVQDMEVDGGKGSAGWPLVPELKPRDGEPLVEKAYGDSFEDTRLATVLAGLGVGRLVVAGAQTDQCIRCTIHGACARGYDVILVSDAHTTEDQAAWGAPPPEQVIAHTNLYWAHHTAPGRKAGTAKTADVDFDA